MSDLPTARDTILTLAIGGASGLVFQSLGISAPFLTGPALMVTLAALFGLHTHVPDRLRDMCMLVLGVGVGAGVTPDVIQAALTWPISFLALTLVLFLTIHLNVLLFSKVFNFSKAEATLASVPGLLSYVIAIAEDKGVSVTRVSLVQTLRVMLLTLAVPPVMRLIPHASVTITAPPETLGYGITALLLISGAGFAWVLRRRNIPAAIFLAGFTVSAVSHLTNATPGQLPTWLGLSAFCIIGTLIGSRFKGVTLTALRESLLAGLTMTFVASLIALIGGTVVALLLNLSPEALFISFAPGGLEVMIALAAQMNVDSTFVAAHHIARLLILMALVPVMLRGLK